MFRLIGVLVALGLVAWLAMKQLDGAGDGAARAAAEASRAAGVEQAVRIDANGSPADVAAQVGRQVEASVAAGKARVDAFENEAAGGAAAGAE
jgi:hypothetical protein